MRETCAGLSQPFLDCLQVLNTKLPAPQQITDGGSRVEETKEEVERGEAWEGRSQLH